MFIQSKGGKEARKPDITSTSGASVFLEGLGPASHVENDVAGCSGYTNLDRELWLKDQKNS
jgi:hypothetical protein